MAGQGSIQDRGSWEVVMEPRLRELFTFSLKRNDDWKQFWNVKKSDKMREEMGEFAGPDVTVETPEGLPYVTLNMSMVRTSSVIHADYTAQIVITHQMKRDKKYSEMEERTWGLAEAVARRPHEEGVKLMYNGFTTAQSSDGKPWFADDHPLKNDSTQYDDNLIVDPFGAEGIKNGIIKLQSTLNENGKPIPMGGGEVAIFTTPTNAMLLDQLSNNGDWLPNSANFNRNTFKIKGYVLPFLYMCKDSHRESQWYMQDQAENKNTMFERESPSFRTITDENTDNTIVQARHAFSFIISNHRGTIGSRGLGV